MFSAFVRSIRIPRAVAIPVCVQAIPVWHPHASIATPQLPVVPHPSYSAMVRPFSSADTGGGRIQSLLVTSTKVGDLLDDKGAEVHHIPANTPLKLAAAAMVQNKAASLLVKDDQGKVVGIITERDYLKSSTFNDMDTNTPVKEAMTPVSKMVYVSPSASLQMCLELMDRHQVRHIPVFDADMKERGVLSIKDIVRCIVRDHEDEVARLHEYIAGNMEYSAGGGKS